MEASSTVVIKAKCGEMLRRFNAQVVGGKLAFTLDELHQKIRSLFSLSPDVKLILTYVDEDDDVVHLVDADDMDDMVKQDLNPIRITVLLSFDPNETRRSPQEQQSLQDLYTAVVEVVKRLQNLHPGVAENFEKSAHDIASKALGSSQHVAGLVDTFSKVGQQPLQNLHTGVAEILKTCPEPLRETLVNVLSDITSKALGSSQHVAEVVDTFSKVGLSFLGQFSDTQTRRKRSENNEPESNLSKMDNNEDSDVSKVNALENSGSVKKVQPKGDKEDKLELRDASGKSPSGSKQCNLNKKPSGSQFGPNITPLPSAYPSPKLYQYLGISEVPPILSTSYATPHGVALFEKNTGQSYGAGPTFFHYGVRCNGCGINPITGPRFKSKVKWDYDLCSSCFSEKGNHTDYIRMDRPAVYHNHVSANGIYNYALTQPQVYCKPSKSKPRPFKLDCYFIQDVNVLDGTVMAPLTPFTKVWRMRNNGTVEWPQKTGLAFIGGDLLKKDFFVELEIPPAGVQVGQQMDVAIDFLAPEHPGMYVSYWRMVSPQGKQFGQRIWVLIEVDTSGQKMPSVNVTSGLNLNLPPVSSSLGRNPEPVPTVEDSQSQIENDKKTADQLVEPTVEMQPDYSQEMKFPINDGLLVDNCASSSHLTTLPNPFPAVQNSIRPPMNESVVSTMADMGASSSAPPPTVCMGTPRGPESKIELPGKMEVEEKLLKELEQMGFKEIDLNKEVLRVNEYDLEQVVDDLIDDSNSDSDWDPILDELREMGFGDVETNKKLLEKNNGSITRVVMDLIAKEDNI